MKQGLFTVAGLSIIAVFVTFFPAVSRSEEGAPAQEENAPPAAESQQAAEQSEPSDKQHAGPDNAWKEKLEERQVDFMGWLQENFPDKANEILAYKNETPEKFAEKVNEAMTVYEPIQRADRYSPELASVLRKDLELQDQRDDMIRQIGQAAEADRPALIGRLREIVSERFDNIIRKKQMIYDHLRSRLERLEERLEEQAKELEQLKADKEKSVEERMKELIEQHEKTNWK